MRAVAMLLLLFCMTAEAGWREDVGPASRLGEGRFCVLGFCLYDAELWSANNPLAYEQPFALVLSYRRSIGSERLVETSISEMRRLADRPVAESTLARWRQEMRRAFVSVNPGDSICGVFLPGVGARFYLNGTLTAQIDDPQFARAFFDIWLSPETRARSLRRQLLGEFAERD